MIVDTRLLARQGARSPMNRRIVRSGMVAAAVLAGAAVVLRRRGRLVSGRTVPGGILMDDVESYDHLSWLLRPFFRGVAADVATVAAPGSRVLEVGCGPGWLSIRMAGSHGLDVTGVDLDPAMIQHAIGNANRTDPSDHRRPWFVVGDVAALPFEAGSFDVVVSTFSMHHWSDASAGLAEIARVLRPGGRAIIWDLAPGRIPFHGRRDRPIAGVAEAGLRLVSQGPWRWPWRFTLAQRFELARDENGAEDDPVGISGSPGSTT